MRQRNRSSAEDWRSGSCEVREVRSEGKNEAPPESHVVRAEGWRLGCRPVRLEENRERDEIDGERDQAHGERDQAHRELDEVDGDQPEGRDQYEYGDDCAEYDEQLWAGQEIAPCPFRSENMACHFLPAGSRGGAVSY